MRICDSVKDVKLYKNRYCLAFYDKTGEYLLQLFDNVAEILSFQKKELSRYNKQMIMLYLYRALKSKEHFCTFLTGEVMRVYLIDMAEE